jgi:hypothetical protein
VIHRLDSAVSVAYRDFVATVGGMFRVSNVSPNRIGSPELQIIPTTLRRRLPDAITLYAVTVGERTEIDVFEDGHVEVTRFRGDESVESGMEVVGPAGDVGLRLSQTAIQMNDRFPISISASRLRRRPFQGKPVSCSRQRITYVFHASANRRWDRRVRALPGRRALAGLQARCLP